MAINSYKELIMWKKAMELVMGVYRVTRKYPKEELFGLVSQSRRAAISIPSNIAEGWTRQHSPEYQQFLSISLGSAAELETQVIAAHNLGFIDKNDFTLLVDAITEEMKMLNAAIRTLKQRRAAPLSLTPIP